MHCFTAIKHGTPEELKAMQESLQDFLQDPESDR
jgi:hypothetical protein